MIPTVVQDYAYSARNGLYELGQLDIGVVARIVVVPTTVACDIAIGIITPLLQTIESIAFAIISVFPALYYLAQGNVLEAGRATKMVLINLSEAVQNLVRFTCNVIFFPESIFAFLSQVVQRGFYYQIDEVTGRPKKNPSHLEVRIQDLPGLKYQFYEKNTLCDDIIDTLRNKTLVEMGAQYVKGNPLYSRLNSLSQVFLDVGFEVIRPVINMIGAIVKMALNLVGALLSGCALQYESLKNCLYSASEAWHAACYFLMQSIASTALCVFTLLSQIFTILYDPMQASHCKDLYNIQAEGYFYLSSAHSYAPQTMQTKFDEKGKITLEKIV